MRGTHPAVPGVYLAGIGENWEVYINGELIATQMHLDDAGQVKSGRSMRGVVFPLDKQILREGENTIVFRIAGAYMATDTGFFYSSGYYISDYTEIRSQRDNIITIVFCAIYFFMGLYHLLLFIVRKSAKYNLTYFLYALVIAVYFCSRTSISTCSYWPLP